MHVDFNKKKFGKNNKRKTNQTIPNTNRRVMEEETAARRGSIAHPKVGNVDIGLRFRR